MIDYQIPTIAIVNQKGGVGKTTVATTLAESAAIQFNKRVLFIDLDMQCNSSDYWVGMNPSPSSVGGQIPPLHPEYDGDPNTEERSTIADTFYGKEVLPYSTYIAQDKGYDCYVEVLLGHPEKLEEINTQFDNASGLIEKEVHERIALLVHQPAITEAYDLVILDTGPSRNPVFRAALRAATHAVIPFEPEAKSIQGINAMIQALISENYCRTFGRDLDLIGLLPNKVRSTNVHANTLAKLRENSPDYLCPKDIFLPQSTAYPERDVKGINPRSIFQIRESHKARIAAERVGSYFLSRVFSDIHETHRDDVPQGTLNYFEVRNEKA